jgi:hypothetical protein
VHAQLAEGVRRATAGTEAAFELTVTNVGPTADGVSIELLGDAAAWATVHPPSLHLEPGAEGHVTVRVRPPGDAVDAAGGALDIGIVVRSTKHPDLAAMELATLEVAPPAPEVAPPAPEVAPAAPEVAPAAPEVAPAAPEVAPAAPEVGPRVPARGIAAVIAAVALVAVATVAVVAILPGAGPAASPTAVTTPAPSATAIAPAPTATPTLPVATATPAAQSPDPGLPVAWWQDAHDAATAAGASLGLLVTEGTTYENLPYAEFQNGAVIQRVEDVHWLSDEAWAGWRALGGGPGPAAVIGYPTSGPMGPDRTHGRQLFDEGGIFWSPASGVHPIHGPVWEHWMRLVRDRGGDVANPADSGLVEPLGYPTSGIQIDDAGSWVALERGRIGFRTDGLGWACSTDTPPTTFAACSAVDPRP